MKASYKTHFRCVTDETTKLRFLVLQEKKPKKRSSKSKEREKRKETPKKTSKDDTVSGNAVFLRLPFTSTLVIKTDSPSRTSKKTKTIEKITVTHETAVKSKNPDEIS